MEPAHERAGNGASLGTLLRAWRERALLTQDELAAKAGLNPRTIRRLELNGPQRPRASSIIMLAKALALDPAEEKQLIAALRAVLPAASAVEEPEAHTWVPPRQLPPRPAHFVGRLREFAALDDIATREGEAGKVLAIVGRAGIGKTALAVQWCSMVAEDFPDGQLYVNLRGFGPLDPVEPLAALHTLLRGLGVAPEEIADDVDAASALLRSRTSRRRMLLLLDNALNSEQVRPLLPADSCVTIVTSRNQLRGLVAHDATARVSLQSLEPSDSIELLSRVSGRTMIEQEEAVRELTDLCDNFPLALRIIGEKLGRQPDTPLADIVDEIANNRDRLDAFYSGDDIYSDLRAVLRWSYRHLDHDAAWMLRAVGGLYPGAAFSTAAAGALAGFSLPKARQLLDRLVSMHLVEQHDNDRYFLHDLVRAYAAESSRQHDAAAICEASVLRLLDWFLKHLYAADAAFAPDRLREPMVVVTGLDPFPDLPAALRWCELEHQTLTSLPAWAYAHGAHLASCQIAYLLESFMAHYKHYYELLDSHKAAVKAVRHIDNPRLEGHLLSAMGNAYDELQRFEDSSRCHAEALRVFQECGDRRGEAKVLSNIAATAITTRDYESARTRCQQALAVAAEAGYERGRAHTLDTLGEAHFGLGDFAAAIDCWHQAFHINKHSGALFVQATNLTNLGRAYSASGDHETAVRYHKEAISAFQSIATPRGEAMALFNLGHAYHARGTVEEAIAAWEQAIVLYSEVDDAKAAEVWREIHKLSQDRKITS
ncbi:MAG TPA: tetratricopeptide repeat protein [Nonomuraea sp.]|nr:tetratricopeptide repeat protein [Nonomuraea sp.]